MVVVADRPAMSSAEIDCYGRILSNCRSLVEYGADGSTLFAIKAGVAQILVRHIARKPLYRIALWRSGRASR